MKTHTAHTATLIASISITIFLTTAIPVLSQLPPATKDYINTSVRPAVATLYSQDENGTMKMRCTATAIEEDATSYTFVTAAHCGCEDNAELKSTSAEKTFFFIQPELAGNKVYLKAKPQACGYRTKGDDYFLLTIDKTIKFPILPLGKDPKAMDEFVNVAGPLGVGLQVFTGSVSSEVLDRPVTVPMDGGDIQWTGAILLQIFGVNGGSSGSAVLCLDQKAVCAFVVGSMGSTSIVAMPVSRLIQFRSLLAAGKYPWYKPDPDAPNNKISATPHGNIHSELPRKLELSTMDLR